MDTSSGGLRHGLLTLAIADVDELYACYMPFVAGGGVFIPTHKTFALGEEVFVLMELYWESEKIPLVGKAVWITPPGAVTNRKQGIGIQLNNDSAELVAKIETQLTDLLASDRATHSL